MRTDTQIYLKLHLKFDEIALSERFSLELVKSIKCLINQPALASRINMQYPSFRIKKHTSF